MSFGIGYDEGFKCGVRAGVMRAVAVMRNAVDGGHAEMRAALEMLVSGTRVPTADEVQVSLQADAIQRMNEGHQGDPIYSHGVACPCGACAPQTAAMRDLEQGKLRDDVLDEIEQQIALVPMITKLHMTELIRRMRTLPRPADEHPRVDVAKAREAAQRLVDYCFSNVNADGRRIRPVFSIPANEKYDDDLVVMAALDALDRLQASGSVAGGSSIGGASGAPQARTEAVYLPGEQRAFSPTDAGSSPAPLPRSSEATKTCESSVTFRDDDHKTLNCELPAEHPSAHRNGEATWTDAKTYETTGFFEEVPLSDADIALGAAATERFNQRTKDAERVRRMSLLMLQAAHVIEQRAPDMAGGRAVLVSQLRDAAADKWDDGEWEDAEGWTGVRLERPRTTSARPEGT